MRRFSLRAGRPILAAAFRPDGKYLAIAGGRPDESDLGAITIVGVDDDSSEQLDGSEPITRALAWSPDGSLLIAGGRDRLARVYAMPAGKLVAGFENARSVLGIAWSPDNATIAICGGAPVEGERELVIYRITARAPRLAIEPIANPRTHAGGVSAVAFSPSGAQLASAGYDGTVRLYDLAGNEQHVLQHGAMVTSVAYAPDGTQLVSAGHDATARIWDAATGAAVDALHRRGRAAAHDDYIACVRYSADGRNIVTAGNDGRVLCWHTNPGMFRTETATFDAPVWTLAIDDGGNLAMAALDGTVHVLPESYAF